MGKIIRRELENLSLAVWLATISFINLLRNNPRR